jgi:hypothetical protein
MSTVGGGTPSEHARARMHAHTHTRNNSGGNNESPLSLQINTSIGRYAARTQPHWLQLVHSLITCTDADHCLTIHAINSSHFMKPEGSLRVWHGCTFLTKPVQFTPSSLTPSMFILMQYFHLLLGLACGSFNSVFQIKILHALLFPLMRATCLIHHIFLNVIVLLISLYNSLQSTVDPALLGLFPDILRLFPTSSMHNTKFDKNTTQQTKL